MWLECRPKYCGGLCRVVTLEYLKSRRQEQCCRSRKSKEQIMSTTTDTNEAILQQYREASQTLGAVGAGQPVYEDEVRLSLGPIENSNPIAAVASAVKGGANMYGACSIQTFAASTGAGGLSHTHEDATGWINYVN